MYLPTSSIDTILDAVKEMQVREDEVLTLFFGENTVIDYELLISQLKELKIEFLGAFFPGIINVNQSTDKGLVLEKYPIIGKPCIIENIEDAYSIMEDWRSDNFIENGILKPTIFTFVDGLSAFIAPFLDDLYNVLGSKVNYIGGGAGSLSLTQKPCLITNKGLLQDAAILCNINLEVKLGVRHGWEKIYGPIVATRTEKNIIYELNWQNAFEVYNSIIKEDCGQAIEVEHFFDVAKAYPFGIIRDINEDIVRDPIAVGSQGELICVGEVPNNSVLSILKGKNTNLIQSASRAAKDVKEAVREEQIIKQIFLVDCISRVLFLKDDFNKELQAVSDVFQEENQETEQVGVLSLGEISSDGNGLLLFYNKTMVVGALTTEK